MKPVLARIGRYSSGAGAFIASALTDIPAAFYAHYFETHASRLNYKQARLKGYSLRSGIVESGNKQFKQRFCGAEMRWQITNMQPTTTIRGVVLSDTFDVLWDAP